MAAADTEVLDLDQGLLTKSEHKDVSNENPVRHPFWFGGSASCLAAAFTHPLDLGESQCKAPRNDADLQHQSRYPIQTPAY